MDFSHFDFGKPVKRTHYQIKPFFKLYRGLNTITGTVDAAKFN